MRTAIVPAVILIAAAGVVAPAQTRLQTKVYTSPPDGISVTSTLISGERDAVLVDPQFLLSEAHKVAAMILESKRNLTAVYSTHAHPDHYFGLAVMKQAFPTARLVALPSVVTGIKNGWEARYKFWSATYGNNLPSTGPILPEELTGTTLMLEGESLQIVGGVQGDGPNNSFVWIPSIRTVVAGDIVFSGVHFGVPSGNNRTEWLKALDQITALNPAVVIPGHHVPGAKNDRSAIEFMKKYMQDWDKSVAASKSADELRAQMKKLYPTLGMENLLNNGATAAFQPARGR
jgi:glyoxylase-like metal-dependent hydrolase (beta-lactamase superfamily II)